MRLPARLRIRFGLVAVAIALFGDIPGVPSALAAEVAVAVAANFLEPLERLREPFTKETGHDLRISSGSTGQLYAQVRNGAPFAVFLSADAERPRLLEKEGLAVPGSRFTYALGRLVLWSADPARIAGDGVELLRSGGFRHLAVANPELAPYGAAAKEALQELGLWKELEAKIVRGEDIGLTFQFVATGNAEIGFVALSQVLSPRNARPGSSWEVPARLHHPIRQDAVLLTAARNDDAAKAFLRFLRSIAILRRIESAGYGVPDSLR